MKLWDRAIADALVAADKGALSAELKAKLDDITQEWRASDADR